MRNLTLFEFDTVIDEATGASKKAAVPSAVFSWLESLCLRNSNMGEINWLKLTQRNGQRVIQFTNYVGVLRAPNGYQLEILPKTGRNNTDENTARQQLIKMLRCLNGFRHIQTHNAQVAQVRMPLLEVFIRELLTSVQSVVKRGLRSDYVTHRDNLFALRGKLLMASHLRSNLTRPDRFYTEHDEFSPNRPENRLLHLALQRVLTITQSQQNQRLARELCFVFADVPESTAIDLDLQRIRLDCGMGYYEAALDWAKLLIKGLSPLTSSGAAEAPSLLFPMEAVFEAYVKKYLPRQLVEGAQLIAQARSQFLVEHLSQPGFGLKPDLLICKDQKNGLVLDTKWKLLNTKDKNYGLSPSDFYQLYAYGHHYLDGQGDVVLIYPKTDMFSEPLPVFTFPKTPGLRLWVLPFCLENDQLLLPPADPIDTSEARQLNQYIRQYMPIRRKYVEY